MTEPDCCVRQHVTATTPWTCSCVYHQIETTPIKPGADSVPPGIVEAADTLDVSCMHRLYGPCVRCVARALWDRERGLRAELEEVHELVATEWLEEKRAAESQVKALREALTMARDVISLLVQKAPGYDWNSDSLSLTLQTGTALAQAEKALGASDA